MKVVELRAAGVSTLDATFLHGQVLGGTIFKDFSPQEREVIWNNIRAFKGIIPSLFTFFEDVKFLEACVDGVKRLVTVSPDQTVLTVLNDLFLSRKETQWIQITETTFQSKKGSLETCRTLGVLQLLAFGAREHSDLPKHPVKKNLKTTPRAKADQDVLQRFASLAERLGFDSPEIRALKRLPIPPIVQDTQ